MLLRALGRGEKGSAVAGSGEQSRAFGRKSSGRRDVDATVAALFWMPVREFARSAAEFFYPACCPLCSRVLADRPGAVGGWPCPLCDSCQQAVLPRRQEMCFRCGLPVGPYVDTSDGCPACRRRSFSFQRVVRLGLYEDELRAACIRSKEPGGEALAAALARLLWETRRNDLEAIQADLIVPVPHHWLKRLFRPHNSAETIARVLARCLKVPYGGHILAKVRWTPDQSSLPSQRRRMNLRGAFRVGRSSRVAGKTVLLVDDILTTGTTADQCARALRQAQARRVVVAVVAVVPKGAT